MSTQRLEGVEAGKGNRVKLVLGENPFHPAGGGQPGDSGWVEAPGLRCRILDCRMEEGAPVLLGEVLEGTPVPGAEVEARVDEERHHLLARMHSGEHALSRALEKNVPGLRVFKVNVDTKESLITLRWEGELTWEVLFAAEAEANGVIRADLPVTTRVFSREEARVDPDLKANWDRLEGSGEAPESLRVVSLGDYDKVACCGSHVERTGQIGGVLITGFKGTAPHWEVRYTVHRDELLEAWSRPLRRLVRQVGSPPEELEKVYGRLQEERSEARRLLDRLRPFLALPFREEPRGEASFLRLVLPGLPLDLITGPCKEKIQEDPKRLVLALLPDEGERSPFLVCRGAGLTGDLKGWLKGHPELAARGGGSPDWISGVTQERDPEKWAEALKEVL